MPWSRLSVGSLVEAAYDEDIQSDIQIRVRVPGFCLTSGGGQRSNGNRAIARFKESVKVEMSWKIQSKRQKTAGEETRQRQPAVLLAGSTLIIYLLGAVESNGWLLVQISGRKTEPTRGVRGCGCHRGPAGRLRHGVASQFSPYLQIYRYLQTRLSRRVHQTSWHKRCIAHANLRRRCIAERYQSSSAESRNSGIRSR